MNTIPIDGRAVLDRLAATTTGADVLEVLGETSTVESLAGFEKEPSIRKAVMLLAQPDSALGVAERLRRLAFLSAFSTLKHVRSITEEFAPRALAEPLPNFSVGLSQSEKTLIATWVSGRKVTWMPNAALRTALIESSDEKLCQAYTAIYVSGTPHLGFSIERLTGELIELKNTEIPLGVAGRRNLCRALAHVVAKVPSPSGKGLPTVLAVFFAQILPSDSTGLVKEEKADLAYAIGELVLALVARFQGLLLSGTLHEAALRLETGWISPDDRKWKQFRKELFTWTEKLTTLFALGGVCATELVTHARSCETVVGATEAMCRKILEHNDILSEEVAAWLAKGGGDMVVHREPSSDTEAVAQLLLRADEFASLDPSRGIDNESALKDALLTELNQLAVRKGLQLDSARNGIVAHDPLRQRSTSQVPSGGRVRVLSPGVVRKTESGVFQVVQAIVEPAQE